MASLPIAKSDNEGERQWLELVMTKLNIDGDLTSEETDSCRRITGNVYLYHRLTRILRMKNKVDVLRTFPLEHGRFQRLHSAIIQNIDKACKVIGQYSTNEGATPIQVSCMKKAYFDIPHVRSLRELEHGENMSQDDLPILFLKKLERLSSGARDEPCKRYKDVLGLTPRARRERSSDKSAAHHDILPHPLDVQLLAFLNSRFSLQRVICYQMFMCKLAVPFIVPTLEGSRGNHHLTCCTLDQITLQWYETGEGIKQANALQAPSRFISFVRYTSSKTDPSKSFVLNHLLQTGHNTFYTRECARGSCKRKLSNGTVELAWYQPTEDTSDELSGLIGFLNLRGDAACFQVQSSFLDKVSDMIVIFSNYLDLESEEGGNIRQMFKRSFTERRVIIIAQDLPEDTCHFEAEQEIILSADANHDELCSTLVDAIQRKLHFRSAEVRHDISYIENEAPLQELTIDRRDKNHCSDNIPTFLYSLQNLHIECFRHRGNGKQTTTVQKGNERQTSDKVPIHLSEKWVKLFLEEIKLISIAHQGNEDQEFCNFCQQLMLNFLYDVGIALENNSIQSYANRLEKYNQALSKLAEARALRDTVIEQKLKSDLTEAEINLQYSIGAEHFIREVASMYLSGSLDTDIKTSNCISHFPRIMAQMFLNGYPMEIMEGDSSAVNLDWLKYVFLALTDLVRDSKVYVLSAMGMQSSGKSTLLNALFGLQFRVSVGKCTKGVHANLIKLDRKTIEHLGLEYHHMLVIDAEGLFRESSQDNKHNNQLATLVIGLSDLTLINIKGENYHSIGDAMQIAVHAFLRMKLVSSRIHQGRRCIFVHHNVSDIGASEKTKIATQKLRESLDLAAQEAAKMENHPGISTVDDVIQHDWDNHVYHFPDLWRGDPPMAPVNTSYSSKVLKLKNEIFRTSSGFNIGSLPFSDLFTRLSDLWNGIVSDNFVLNFRNTLEVKEYRLFESKLSSIKSSLKHVVSGIVSTLIQQMREFTNVNQLEQTSDRFMGTIDGLVKRHAEAAFTNSLTPFLENDTSQAIDRRWDEIKATLECVAIQLANEAKRDVRGTKNTLIDKLTMKDLL